MLACTEEKLQVSTNIYNASIIYNHQKFTGAYQKVQ